MYPSHSYSKRNRTLYQQADEVDLVDCGALGTRTMYLFYFPTLLPLADSKKKRTSTLVNKHTKEGYPKKNNTHAQTSGRAN